RRGGPYGLTRRQLSRGTVALRSPWRTARPSQATGGTAMAMISLGEAARLTRLGKTTLARAIKAGRPSAGRKEDGGYEIDPFELASVYRVYLPGEATDETVAQPIPWCTARPLTPRWRSCARLPRYCASNSAIATGRSKTCCDGS